MNFVMADSDFCIGSCPDYFSYDEVTQTLLRRKVVFVHMLLKSFDLPRLQANQLSFCPSRAHHDLSLVFRHFILGFSFVPS